MAKFKENALRVIAVVGLIAILLLGAWGIIQLAFIIPGFFGNIGKKATPVEESLTLSAPASINSGDTLSLGWQHKGGSGEYSYAVSYACQDGVSLKAPTASGSWQAVGCNTPFNYTNATRSTTLVVTNTNTSAKPIDITVAATKLSSGEVRASAAARVSVAAGKTATQTTTTIKKPTSSSSGATYVRSTQTKQLYGYPDLSVTITSNPGTVRAGSRVTLQFVVQNTGTNTAAQGWSFTASLPLNPSFSNQGQYTYNSGAQQALNPGDKIVYTLGYDAQFSGQQYTQTGGCDGWTYPCNPGQPVYGGPGTCNSYGPCSIPGYYPNLYGYYNPGWNQQTASVQVDPYNLVWELSEANNSTYVSYTVY